MVLLKLVLPRTNTLFGNLQLRRTTSCWAQTTTSGVHRTNGTSTLVSDRRGHVVFQVCLHICVTTKFCRNHNMLVWVCMYVRSCELLTLDSRHSAQCVLDQDAARQCHRTLTVTPGLHPNHHYKHPAACLTFCCLASVCLLICAARCVSS